MNLINLLCCPICKKKLVFRKKDFYCKECKNAYPIKKDVPDFSIVTRNPSVEISKIKWDKKYIEDAKKNIIQESKYQEDKFFGTIWNQILNHYTLKKNDVFLELGSGLSFFARRLAKEGMRVVGIDISMEALQISKKIFEREGIKNYLLVCGNVLDMPFNNNSFDLVYGGGVIEHFKDTQEAIQEFLRVLNKNGTVYNTVPYLNIGTLTYRQIWGNIPRFPIIEPFFTFIHTKLLASKHMRFGYELSFTRSYLETIHKICGFSKVSTGQHKGPLDFDYLPTKFLRHFAKKLATNSSLFWPMIYVAAKK